MYSTISTISSTSSRGSAFEQTQFLIARKLKETNQNSNESALGSNKTTHCTRSVCWLVNTNQLSAQFTNICSRMYALICTYICCYSYRSTCFSILSSPLLFLYYFSEVSALYSHCFGFCAARSYSNCFIFVLFFLFRISHGFGILVRRETIANHIDTGVYKLKWIIIIRNTRENIKQTK